MVGNSQPDPTIRPTTSPRSLRMKIAILITRLDSGGVERAAVRLISGFLAEGHSVDVLTTSKTGRMLAELPNGANLVNIAGIIRLPGIPGLVSPRVWLGLTSLIPLAKYLNRTRPDVLLATQSGLTAVLARYLARSRTRTVLRVASSQKASIEKDPYRVARLLPLVRKFAFKHADRVIVNSRNVADEIMNSTGISRSRIDVIPNPSADPEIFLKAQEPITHSWLDNPEFPTAIAVGRLTAQKDYPTLLKAHAAVIESSPCKLVIVGEGEERETLASLTDSLGTSPHVDFVGYSDNPWSLMARATVYLLTSAWEGSPSSLIEALALGVPSVATDSPGGTSEVLGDGKFGLLAPVGDSDAIARAWLEILQNPGTARTRAELGVKESARYAPSTVVRQYTKVLQS